MSGGQVNIQRSRPRVEFTSLPNRVANDAKLSARNLGVLYYVLTKPPGWRVIPAQLGARFGISYRIVLTIMRELQAAGYVRRELTRDRHQRITGVRYLVSDEPGQFDTASDDAPALDLGDAACRFSVKRESRQTEKRHSIKKKESNKPLPLTPSPERAAKPKGLSGGDQGAIQVEIAKRIGPTVQAGFGVLFDLPPAELDQACAMQRRGTLDDRALHKLRARAIGAGEGGSKC